MVTAKKKPPIVLAAKKSEKPTQGQGAKKLEESPSVKRRSMPSVPWAGRIVFAIVALGGLALGARWAASQAVPNEVRVPTREQVDAFPYELGPWKGEEDVIDEKIIVAVGADLTLNRTYRQSAVRSVSLHAAVFSYSGFSLPHPPELCYGGTGWRVRQTRDADLTLSDGTTGAIRILTLEKETGRDSATVLYCYQLAGPFAADRDLVRRLFWRYRGQKSRPPLVKIMLHIPGSGAEVEELGLDFAKRVLDKFAEMQKTW